MRAVPRGLFLLGCLLACLATFVARSRLHSAVFLPLPAKPAPGVLHHDGVAIVPRGFDSYYHLRRIEQVALHDAVLPDADPFLNYSLEGPPVRPYWPVGYDTLIGTIARLTGARSRGAVWWLACWAAPAIAALNCLLLCLLAAPLVGRRAALVAGLAFAIVPWADLNDGVGVVDHHIVEQSFALLVPLLFLRQLGKKKPRAWLVGVLLGCLGLVWTGGILLLGLVSALAVAQSTRDLERRGLQAAAQLSAAACLTTLLILPLSWWGRQLRFDYTPLSWMVFCQYLGAALWLGGLHRFAGRLPRSRPRFWTLAVGSGVLVAGLLVALVPPLRVEILAGLSYLDKSDAMFALVRESRPFHQIPLSWPQVLWWCLLGCQVAAWLGFALLWSARPEAQRSWPLVWGSLGLLLVLAQSFRFIRWWDGFAALAIGVCLVTPAEKWKRLCRGAAMLGLLLMLLMQARNWNLSALPVHWSQSPAPAPTTTAHAPLLEAVIWLAGNSEAVDPRAPEYGVLAHPDLGHWLIGYAQRPALGTPFGQAPAHVRANRECFELFLRPVAQLALDMDRLGYRYIIVHDPFRFPFGAELQGILGQPEADRIALLQQAAGAFEAGRDFSSEELSVGILHLWARNGVEEGPVRGSERFELVALKDQGGLPIYKIFRLRAP